MLEEKLEVLLIELGCQQEQFLLVAAKGLESTDNKKYYEQLIACDNFLYFKSMMVKRNMQLEEQAFQMLVKNDPNAKEEFAVDPKWQDKQKMREQNEIECALAMSLALDEERKKLQLLEDDELRVIIKA
jgi:hypothetical protein